MGIKQRERERERETRGRKLLLYTLEREKEGERERGLLAATLYIASTVMPVSFFSRQIAIYVLILI
jgi:hypothetical protein